MYIRWSFKFIPEKVSNQPHAFRRIKDKPTSKMHEAASRIRAEPMYDEM